jgi:hypothetical protein
MDLFPGGWTVDPSWGHARLLGTKIFRRQDARDLLFCPDKCGCALLQEFVEESTRTCKIMLVVMCSSLAAIIVSGGISSRDVASVHERSESSCKSRPRQESLHAVQPCPVDSSSVSACHEFRKRKIRGDRGDRTSLGRYGPYGSRARQRTASNGCQ